MESLDYNRNLCNSPWLFYVVKGECTPIGMGLTIHFYGPHIETVEK